MSDTLIKIIAIFVAAILMFIFPVVNITAENDQTIQTVVQTLTVDYVSEIVKKGRITWEDYESFFKRIHATRKYI